MRAACERLTRAAQSGDWTAAAEALSALTALCKKQEARKEIEAALAGTETVTAALGSAEPKARKNAARLLSAIGKEADAAALSEALLGERTRFVVPSLLLALGAVGGKTARAALEAYTPPLSTAAEEDKHCREIAEAHRKALSRLHPKKTVTLHRFFAEQTVLLRHSEGFAEALVAELTALGLPAERTEAGRTDTGRTEAGGTEAGVRTRTDSLDRLYRARCFFEVLLECGTVPLDPQTIAAAARRGYLSFDGGADAPQLPYRVELRGYAGDRGALIRAIAAAVGGQDSPSGYAWELRVEVSGAQCGVFVRPSAVNDSRFAYRQSSLPASIHPVTAAAIARAASIELGRRQGVTVYDPCCGSGTLLIEAAHAMDCASLMGTDISAQAVQIARQNAAAAHCRAAFLQKDCRRFAVREPYDLVLANLPFGNRVGSHADNTALYRALAARLPALLKPDGLAVLYTMEGRLLEKCLSAAKELQTVRAVRTEAGGLMPIAFFCRRTEG